MRGVGKVVDMVEADWGWRRWGGGDGEDNAKKRSGCHKNAKVLLLHF